MLNEVDSDDHMSRFAETIERILQKYNIDATACTQRTLCMSVRDASQNVAKGIGTSSEKILDGITRYVNFIAFISIVLCAITICF